MSLLARGGDPLESGPKAMFIHRRGPLTTWAPRARQPGGPGEFADRTSSAGSPDARGIGLRRLPGLSANSPRRHRDPYEKLGLGLAVGRRHQHKPGQDQAEAQDQGKIDPLA